MIEPNAAAPPDLHPLTVGEILDRAISIYRKDFVTLAGIVAIVSVPVLAVQVAAGLIALPADLNQLLPSDNSPSPSFATYAPILGYYFVTLVTALVSGVATIFQLGAVAVAVSTRYHNQETSITGAYGQSLRHWPSMLAAAILVALANLAVGGVFFGIAFGLPIAAALGLSGGNSSSDANALALLAFPLMCLGSIPALVLLIFLNIRWIFTQQAIVLEDLGPLNGLGRSWSVVKGSFWRVLGVTFLLAIFVYIITAIPTSLVGAAVVILAPGSFLMSTVLNNLTQTIIVTLVTPIQFAVLTLLYYDLRIRKEGYDLELRAQSMQLLNPSPAGSAE